MNDNYPPGVNMEPYIGDDDLEPEEEETYPDDDEDAGKDDDEGRGLPFIPAIA